jgi:hypothetical protein
MTSIEWLYKLSKERELDKFDFEQAKEMHKQEIIDAHNSGFEKSAEGWNGEYGLMDMNNISEEIGSEQYYQNTFKKD